MADEKLINWSQDIDKVGNISAGMTTLQNEMHKGKFVRLYTSDDRQAIISY